MRALTFPRPGYRFVGDIYDVQADEALTVSGMVRLAFVYASAIDPSSVALVRIAKGTWSFLDID